MEFMVIAVAFILVVLGLYLFIEQSILRRYGIVETMDHWQNYFDALAAWREAAVEINALLDAEEKREFTLLDRITNALRW